MLNELIKLAELLDNSGREASAKCVDGIICRYAQWAPDWIGLAAQPAWKFEGKTYAVGGSTARDEGAAKLESKDLAKKKLWDHFGKSAVPINFVDYFADNKQPYKEEHAYYTLLCVDG